MNDKERWLSNDQKLAQLDPAVRERFEGVVKRLEVAGHRPLVVETRRGALRQAWLRARGLSLIRRSKHQDGHAADIISADVPWPRTTIEFMADLALAAREEGLATGLTWKLPEPGASIIQMSVQQGWKQRLVGVLGVYGYGFDPCHVELP